jgi:hypothetical protein
VKLFHYIDSHLLTQVTFNWILDHEASPDEQRTCIEMEYRLRPRITRFLMKRFERELKGDFSSFYFDVDLTTRQIRISDKTPVKYIQQIASDFLAEMNQEALMKDLYDVF